MKQCTHFDHLYLEKMEEQFQKYLSRKREALRSSPQIDSTAEALSTMSEDLATSENDRTDDKRFNPTPPPILIGKHCCLKQTGVVLSDNEIILTKINLSKIPNTQLEKETAKIKMKYHIRRLRIARRLILNRNLHSHEKNSPPSLVVNSKHDR